MTERNTLQNKDDAAPPGKSMEDMPDIVLQNILGNLDASSLSSVSQVDRRHYHATQNLLPSVSIIVNRRLIPHAAFMKLVSTGNEDAIVHVCVNSIYARPDGMAIQDILPLINYPILKRLAPSIIPYDVGGRKETVLREMLTRGGKLGKLAQILMEKQQDVPLIIPHKKNAYIPLPRVEFWMGDISIRMIVVLTDWLIDVAHLALQMQMNTTNLLLCLYLINYIITILNVEQSELQLYGIACYLIVSRISDNPISIIQAIFITDDAYNSDQMERAISVILALIPPVIDIEIPNVPEFMLLADHQLTVLQRNKRSGLLMLSITEGVFKSTFDSDVIRYDRSYYTDMYGRLPKPLLVYLYSDKHRLIGSGTYGCAYSPAIPCSDSPLFIGQTNEVSKLGSRTELSNERDRIIDVQRIKNRSPSITHPSTRICEPKYLPGDCNAPNEPALLVMPYYGKSLDDKIPKGMTKKEFYHRFRNVLLGIQQMNDAGFYHMDIKPANITIGTDSDPDFHIIDFGMSVTISEITDNDYSEVFRSTYIFWPIESLLLSSIAEEGLNGNIAEQQQKILELFSPVWVYTLLYRLLNKEVRTAKMHELYKSITAKGDKVVRRKVRKLKKTIIHNVDLWGIGISLLKIMTINPRLKDDNLLELIEHILNPDIHSRYTPKQLLDAYDDFLKRL
jgi:serine/threonine protein kinase